MLHKLTFFTPIQDYARRKGKYLTLLSLICLINLLTGCSGYPRLLYFPFERTGKGLNSSASELNPEVSSQYIVFTSDRNGSQDVYLFDFKNRRLIDLPGLNSLKAIASDPSVSADGVYLVFAASIEGRTDIYLYNRNTQQTRNLTQNLKAQVRNPSINEDGSRIAFEIASEGQWDIFICDRNGNPLNLPGLPR
jgi:Tol biopolymer transport system component